MVKEVSIDPTATVMGNTKAPKIVPPPKTKGRLGWEFFDSIVDVKVGREEEEKIFQVHKGVLRNCSSIIKTLLDDGGNDKWNGPVIEIQEENPRVFAYFQRWLYTDNIAETGKAKDVHWSALIGIWLFGDDYSIPEFQDAAMNAMLDKRDIFFRTDKLKYIYQNTEPGSLLRKFFCDKFALTIDLGDKVWFGKHRSEYPSDFLIDIIQQLHCQLSDFDPWLYDDNYMAHHRNRYLLKKAKTPKS